MTTRKLLVFVIALIFSCSVFGQDQKGMRFGMVITPQLDWERSGNTKLYAHDGVNGKFGFGLSTEFRITDNVHFLTGIGGTFSGGGENYNFNDTIGYVTDKSQNIIPIKTINGDVSGTNNNTDYHFYKLVHRDYKTTYITIPVALKMMTKQIGALKYFGSFGGNIEILTKAHANDQVIDMRTNSTATVTITDLNIYSDCIPVKASLNVGAGCEYTLSGSTAVVFSLNYYRSFLSLTRGTSDHLIDNSYHNERITDPHPGRLDLNTSGANALTNHSIYGDGVALTVGILF
jgi:hypothetical protein